ncbi:hypothetical protein N4T20_08115 [Flavobacterium sp. TR2]|uniref:hypothetical protein n=1 Tax=Flavobacterium sp. TR2 TaxID=2977321 RepID=UPI0021B14F58|nr:hypothetical protein [Flavobacterium sp. TR2]UWY29898.1 hypothetical protein N4T20_08115 [Flavobacterium sp. TR2]
MAIKTISGITIMGNSDNYSFHNSKNMAHFTINDGNVSYNDPFGNYMTSSPHNIRINFEPFKLEKIGDRIRKPDGTMMVMLPKEEIQEIASKTFYEEGQFHAIDFLTFIITEEK